MQVDEVIERLRARTVEGEAILSGVGFARKAEPDQLGKSRG
ncbi:hypothetical protein [Sphingobium sp. CCH11-B1]|nr:hypothetical protein [Sphingobium sp. CCH11-B1]